MKTKLILLSLLFFSLISFNVKAQVEGQNIDSYKETIENNRNAKNQQLLQTESSPLKADQMDKFDGLSYFPVNADFKIEAQFTADATAKEVSLSASSGTTVNLIKAGTATFTRDGKSHTLTVYQNKNLSEFGNNNNQLFIPFKDLTSGNETNTGGRYLPVVLPSSEGSTMILDFNLAMNPYSAYNSSFLSVMPPEGNNLEMLVKTGERKYEDR